MVQNKKLRLTYLTELEFSSLMNRIQEEERRMIGQGMSTQARDMGKSLHNVLTPRGLTLEEENEIIMGITMSYPNSRLANSGLYNFLHDKLSLLANAGFEKEHKLPNDKLPDLECRIGDYLCGGEIKTYHNKPLPFFQDKGVPITIERQLLSYIDYFDKFFLFCVGYRNEKQVMDIYSVEHIT